MPEEDLSPYPSQAELNEMVEAVTGRAIGLGEPRIVAREGDDLSPVMSQAGNDLAMLVACGPSPDSLPPVNKDVPFVDGAGTVGGTLTCTMGNWTGEPTGYAYQWMANGITVSEAGSSYVIAAGDVGKNITCMVTATNANGSTQAPPSNAVAVNGAAATAARRRG